ncbi:MAG: hypothetical protein D3M94_07445 [Rhodocyclales bacterium GT-UBC]|nr:MAG: hypothetical protein D3M94_07445 [Rhodocyclales bacterium GT-UBC]
MADAKDLTEALHRLTQQANGQTSRDDSALPAAKPVAAIPERVGKAGPQDGKPSGGGGIASPLTETNYGQRSWYAYRTLYSTDGLFPLRVRLPSSIKFLDANASPVEIKPAQPPAQV